MCCGTGEIVVINHLIILTIFLVSQPVFIVMLSNRSAYDFECTICRKGWLSFSTRAGSAGWVAGRWCVEIAWLRTRPCDNQRCDGDYRRLEVHDVCLRRREGYLTLVIVREPSLFSSWLMCRRSYSCVFFCRRRERGGGRSRVAREGWWLELTVIDEKDAWHGTHFLTPVTHVLCHNKWFLCSTIFRST